MFSNKRIKQAYVSTNLFADMQVPELVAAENETIENRRQNIFAHPPINDFDVCRKWEEYCYNNSSRMLDKLQTLRAETQCNPCLALSPEQIFKIISFLTSKHIELIKPFLIKMLGEMPKEYNAWFTLCHALLTDNINEINVENLLRALHEVHPNNVNEVLLLSGLEITYTIITDRACDLVVLKSPGGIESFILILRMRIC